MNANTLERTPAPDVAGLIGQTANAADQRLTSSELGLARLYLERTRNYAVWGN